jgi:predicted Zn finger-like uncharacterized protein
MFRDGSKICCPSCGTRHIVRTHEMPALNRIEMHCTSCGTAVSIVAGPLDKPKLAVEVGQAT